MAWTSLGGTGTAGTRVVEVGGRGGRVGEEGSRGIVPRAGMFCFFRYWVTLNSWLRSMRNALTQFSRVL